jgi:hypothetical protein
MLKILEIYLKIYYQQHMKIYRLGQELENIKEKAEAVLSKLLPLGLIFLKAQALL